MEEIINELTAFTSKAKKYASIIDTINSITDNDIVGDAQNCKYTTIKNNINEFVRIANRLITQNHCTSNTPIGYFISNLQMANQLEQNYRSQWKNRIKSAIHDIYIVNNNNENRIFDLFYNMF